MNRTCGKTFASVVLGLTLLSSLSYAADPYKSSPNRAAQRRGSAQNNYRRPAPPTQGVPYETRSGERIVEGSVRYSESRVADPANPDSPSQRASVAQEAADQPLDQTVQRSSHEAAVPAGRQRRSPIRQTRAEVPSEEGPVPDGQPAQYLEGGPVPDYFPDGVQSYGPAYGPDCGCQDSCCYGAGVGSCCAPCCGSMYASGEYLLWWLTGNSLPPLVTTSPSSTLRPEAGVLGQPGTTVLFGDQTANTAGRSGARVRLGVWLDECSQVEAEWFQLSGTSTSYNNSSDGTPILARPFFNMASTVGAQDSNVIAYPNQQAGSVNDTIGSSFLGAGIQVRESLNAQQNMLGFPCRLDFIYGFRYMGLYENLTANSSSTTLNQGGTFPQGSVVTSNDGFKTSNSFYGATLGAALAHDRGCWNFAAIGRLGIGGTAESVRISGSTSFTEPGSATFVTPGGLLAMPTNIGTYTRTGFTLVPHLELKLAYNLTRHWKWTFGYDVMYWSRVVRPGQQVDLFINPTQSGGHQLAGTPGPLFQFRETDLWIQGISTGVEFRF